MTILSDTPRQHRTRTRRYTNPEVLRAVAHFLERPHAGDFGVPSVSYYSFAGPAAGCVCLTSLAELRAWMRAMDDVMAITVTPDKHGAEVAVTGVVAGPMLKVFVHCWSGEEDLSPGAPREITVAELEALTAETLLARRAVAA